MCVCVYNAKGSYVPSGRRPALMNGTIRRGGSAILLCLETLSVTLALSSEMLSLTSLT